MSDSSINLKAAQVCGNNLGTGYGTYSCIDPFNTLNFKSLVGAGNITISGDSEQLIISGANTGGGEVNTASNIGSGLGLYSTKSGVDLRFKTLLGIGNVTITNLGSELAISGTSVAEAAGLESQIQFNGGGGTGSTGNTLAASSGLTFSASTESLTIGTRSGVAGERSLSHGCSNVASGAQSFAGGFSVQATGDYSHAEGKNACAKGTVSHVEGCNTIACGQHSHAEGLCNTAFADRSHVEGWCSNTCGLASHAEGVRTATYGSGSHSGGYSTAATKKITSCNLASFNHSLNNASQTAGHGALADSSAILGGRNHNIELANTNAVIIGGDTIKLTGSTYIDTTAVDNLAVMSTPTSGSSDQVLIRNTSTGVVEYVSKASLGGAGSGEVNTASNLGGGVGLSSTKVGVDLPFKSLIGENILISGGTNEVLISGSTPTTPAGLNTEIQFNSGGTSFGANSEFIFNDATCSVTIGTRSGTNGAGSFTQGSNLTAEGDQSHAEGVGTCACGDQSHAEGVGTCAWGLRSHAEGLSSEALAREAHAEGNSTCAIGYYSHSEGSGTCAAGSASHAEGLSTIATGNRSHAEGWNSCTLAAGLGGHAEGIATIAGCNGAHSEGYCTSSCGFGSHTGGAGFGTKPIFASGCGSFNHSRNTSSQTVGFGALGHQSAIIGGIDHHITAGNTNAVILGGCNITLTSTSYIDTAAASCLAIINTPTSGSSDQVLIRNTSTGKIEYVSKASLGGGGGGGITNGSDEDEIPKSDSSGNLVSSSIFSLSDGNIQLGSASVAGSVRCITSVGSAGTRGISLFTCGGGDFNIYNNGYGFSFDNSVNSWSFAPFGNSDQNLLIKGAQGSSSFDGKNLSLYGGCTIGGGSTGNGGCVIMRAGSVGGSGSIGGVYIKNTSNQNRIQVNDTGIGFFASAPVAKPTVTGSRGGNAALASLLTQLNSLGLITDSTSA